jgi:hypothetical protein
MPEGVMMTSDLSLDEKSQRAVLNQVNRLAWLLDNSIRIPIVNYRVGLDALIGLIPGLGDTAGMLLSSFILMQAIRIGVPRTTLLRMLLNIGIETLIGMIPIVGDIFDAAFKANMRNVRLLSQAVERQQTGRRLTKATEKGAIALIIGALVAIIVLFVGAGVALFWWVVSLFR